MKKFLIVMGAIFCGLIVLVIVGLAFAVIRGTQRDKESRAYADASIQAIVTTWNEDAFFARASPELKRLVSVADADRLFRSLSQLGRLKHCDPAPRPVHDLPHSGKAERDNRPLRDGR